MGIVCQQTILMKYHSLFAIFEEAAKFEIVVGCKLQVAPKWLKYEILCVGQYILLYNIIV